MDTGETLLCYNIGDTTYHAGECVRVYALKKDVTAKGLPEPQYIAKIKHFIKKKKKNNDEVSLIWYYWPEETEYGRKPYHGAKEVFESVLEERQSVKTILGKCEVLWLKRYNELEFRDADIYYCRFRLVKEVIQLVGGGVNSKEVIELVGGGTNFKIPVYCICEQPFNPDIPMVRCYMCKYRFHFACLDRKIVDAGDGFSCIECLKKNRLRMRTEDWTKYHMQKAMRPLKSAEIEEVNEAFARPRSEVIVPHTRISAIHVDFTVEKYMCLKPLGWLNDEVIDIYFELLIGRQRENPSKFLKCLFFNTFFWKKLMNDGNEAVKRWYGQCNFDDYDKIFVPIHHLDHWCLVVIDQLDQKFVYLDSIKGFTRGVPVMERLAEYYKYHMEEMGRKIDTSTWNLLEDPDCPQQKNSRCDCGMFILKFADFHSRGLDLCFTQSDMLYFRWRTAKEILQVRAD